MDGGRVQWMDGCVDIWMGERGRGNILINGIRGLKDYSDTIELLAVWINDEILMEIDNG